MHYSQRIQIGCVSSRSLNGHPVTDVGLKPKSFNYIDFPFPSTQGVNFQIEEPEPPNGNGSKSNIRLDS